MDVILNKIKINSIVDGLVCIAVGGVMLFWTGMSMALMTNVFGGMLVLAGVLLVMSYFTRDNSAFFGYLIVAAGIIIALFGVWVLTHNYQFQTLIPRLFGVMILVSGLMNLLQSLSLMGNKYKFGGLSFLFAVATCAIGVMFMIRAYTVGVVFMRVLGACLIFNGLTDLWITSRVSKVMKMARLTIQDALQDATAIEVPSVTLSDIIPDQEAKQEETEKRE